MGWKCWCNCIAAMTTLPCAVQFFTVTEHAHDVRIFRADGRRIAGPPAPALLVAFPFPPTCTETPPPRLDQEGNEVARTLQPSKAPPVLRPLRPARLGSTPAKSGTSNSDTQPPECWHSWNSPCSFAIASTRAICFGSSSKSANTSATLYTKGKFASAPYSGDIFAMVAGPPMPNPAPVP